VRKAAVVIGSVVLVALCWQVGPGLASNLTGSSKTLSAGSGAISRCDTDGASLVSNNSLIAPYPIVSVTVSDVAAACGGKTVKVTMSNGTSDASGSAVVPAAGGSVTVTLAPSLAPGDAMRTEALIQ
jgi:hypothetical protein